MLHLVQFYDFNTGWGDRYPLIVGFSESWKIDKSTDSAVVQFIYPHTENFILKPYTWLRILNLENANDSATYDSKGRPINHNQYIVKSSECVVDKINGISIVSVEAGEPIERLDRVITEIRTFTNQTEKSVDINGTIHNFSHESLNYYNATQKLIGSIGLSDEWLTRLNLQNNQIQDDTKKLLESVPFDSCTLNALSIKEYLFDICDSVLERTPVLYFDISPATDRARQSKDSYFVRFEVQDGSDKEIIDYGDLENGAGSVIFSQSADSYATGIVADVDNMATGTHSLYPSETVYLMPEANIEGRDTSKLSDTPNDTWILKLPHPARKINSIKQLIYRGSYNFFPNTSGEIVTVYNYGVETNDLTNNIMEKQVYEATDGANESLTAIVYEQGTDIIHLRGYAYNKDLYTSNVQPYRYFVNGAAVYLVEYEALVSARVAQGDGEFVVPLNQTYSSVASEKLGAFMQDYLKSQAKSDIVIQKTYNNFYDFEGLVGTLVKKDDEFYLVTAVSYKNRNFEYEVVVQLNKDSRRKSENYSANKQIVPNVAIPSDNIKERKIHYAMNRVKLSAVGDTITRTPTIYEKLALSALLPPEYYGEGLNIMPLSDGVGNEDLIDHLQLTAKSNLYENGSLVEYVNKSIFPIQKFIIGKRACFNIKTRDNAVAGIYKNTSEISAPITSAHIVVSQFGRTEEQIPFLYTDFFGEIKEADLFFGNFSTPNAIAAREMGESTQGEYNEVLSYFDSLAKFPDWESLDNLTRSRWRTVFAPNNRPLHKDTLERLNLTASIEFVDGSGTTIDEGFIANTRLMQPFTSAPIFSLSLFSSRSGDRNRVDPIFNCLLNSITLNGNAVDLVFDIQNEDVSLISGAMSAQISRVYSIVGEPTKYESLYKIDFAKNSAAKSLLLADKRIRIKAEAQL